MSWKDNTFFCDKVVIALRNFYRKEWVYLNTHLNLSLPRVKKVLIFNRKAWCNLKTLLKDFQAYWWKVEKGGEHVPTLLFGWVRDHQSQIQPVRDALDQEYFDY